MIETHDQIELAPDGAPPALGIDALSAVSPVTIDCDLIAPWYESVEHLCFGRALERRRNAFLGDLADASRAISCGEGDGRFMTALLDCNPRVEVTAVDASRKMTDIGNRRFQRMNPEFGLRANYVCADIGTFDPPQLYDLIAAHFFLDCFSTDGAARVIQRLASWATPRARWIVSEFAQPASPAGQIWSGAIIRSLYAAFRLTTGLRITRLPDYRPALASQGFELRKVEAALGGLLISELWERG
jgi:ubiquinone/menaquinone biosynthesis C-methylase UbiE